MTLSRVSLPVLVVLTAAVVVTASAATPVRKAKPPRIVAAVVQDADRDARADSVRLTYSVRVRHARDRDGRYPFAVAGYRISGVGAASGKAVVIALVEHAQPDPQARPAIRYARTTRQPVTGLSRMQAAAQLYRSPRPHGRTPPPAPAPGDSDGDGTADGQDCAPRDAAVRPGAPDLPDLAFLDSNCDGIDGTERDAVFVSPQGNDADPGTKSKPKRQVNAALSAAQTGKKHQVLAAAGSYLRVSVVSGVGIYGGYDPATWARKSSLVTSIGGSPYGVLADGATDVALQLLSVRAVNDGASVYGIRAVDGSKLRLERVVVTAGDGAVGGAGSAGADGLPGSPGKPGQNGACDSFVRAIGGAGGESPVGRDGGDGGNGYYGIDGADGRPGLVGTPGGEGGDVGAQQGGFGEPGRPGSNGGAGPGGRGGTSSTGLAAATWLGSGGIDGVYGAPGNGGGGGGAGGGQDGAFVIDGSGNAGSGGGGGGAGGRGGAGGAPGGGSFGIYLYKSSIVAEKSSITAGDGGRGGPGGASGAGGKGGKGGPYIFYCANEIGRGAAGGKGGDGGRGGGGGGGAGGPSIGVMKVGASSAVLTSTAVVVGSAGAGGAAGSGGDPGAPSQPGIVDSVYP